MAEGETIVNTKKYFFRALIFILVGLGIYACVYAYSEIMVYKYTQRNRFFLVKNAPPTTYDWVILGASHAMIFSFEDMNQKLDQLTGTKIINLATLGSGIVPNKLFLDYFFLKNNKTKGVVYVLDMGVFSMKEENEGRLKDVNFFNKAPFDPTLMGLLWSYYSKGLLGLPQFLDYFTGFSKISNSNRYKPDIHAMELMFNEVYSPSETQIIKRVASTDPKEINAKVEADVKRYSTMFAEMIDNLQSQNIKVIACRPALPQEYLTYKKHEKWFNDQMIPLLNARNVPFKDFSNTIPEYDYYFDTDHLNRDGVTLFFEKNFKNFLIENSKK